MMPRKKRITLMVTITIIVVLIIAITIILLYLNTDMFKSNQTLFFKYVGKNVENIKAMEEIFEKTEYDNLLQTNKYIENSELKVNYTQNLGTTLENTDNHINQVKLEVEGQVDKANKYNYKDIKLLHIDSQLFELEYIQNDTIYGIRFSDLFKQYTLAENNNLKDLFVKMGYTEEQIEMILAGINMDQDIISSLQFSEEEIEKLKEKYLDLIAQDFSKENFEAQKNQTITINQERIEVNAYTLKMTKEQLNDIYLKILENLKQDEIILGKIENLQNKINPLDFSISLKERMVQKIEETIDKINRNNIGNEETKIIVYENEGETVRTTIQGADYELDFDYVPIGKEKFVEISIKEKGIQVTTCTLKSKEEGMILSIEKNQNSEPIQIILEQNRIIQGNNSTRNVSIIYRNQDDKVETNIVQNIELVSEFDNPVLLDNQNSIRLDTLESEQTQEILNRVKEAVSNKLNSIQEQISLENIQEVLKAIGVMQDTQKLEGNGVSETEKNRFNAKFEFLQGENLSSDEVLKVIETIQNNFINMQVVSNEQLKLEINRNQGDEEMASTLKTFVEKDKNKKYNVEIEYDEVGLVKYIVLTIVKKQ